jgi:hypothetical protein
VFLDKLIARTCTYANLDISKTYGRCGCKAPRIIILGTRLKCQSPWFQEKRSLCAIRKGGSKKPFSKCGKEKIPNIRAGNWNPVVPFRTEYEGLRWHQIMKRCYSGHINCWTCGLRWVASTGYTKRCGPVACDVVSYWGCPEFRSRLWDLLSWNISQSSSVPKRQMLVLYIKTVYDIFLFIQLITCNHNWISYNLWY